MIRPIVVDGHFHVDAIACKHTNFILPHFAAAVRQDTDRCPFTRVLRLVEFQPPPVNSIKSLPFRVWLQFAVEGSHHRVDDIREVATQAISAIFQGFNQEPDTRYEKAFNDPIID